VTIDAGSVVKFDTTHAAHGVLAGDFSTNATTTVADVGWTTRIGTQTQIWGRAYYYTTSTAAEARILRVLDGAARVAAFKFDNAGKLVLSDAAGANVAVGTTTVPTNQWVRLEYHVIAGPTSGIMEAKLFTTADGTTPTEVLSPPPTNTGAKFTGYRFGATSAVAVVGPFWMDDLQINNTGWPGPNSSSNVIANNTFEGGTSGTTISTANSGGLSGDAWDLVTIGASATATYDSARSAHGNDSGSFTTPAGAVTTFTEWNTRVGTQTEIWGRVYYFDDVNNVNARPIRVFNGAGLAGAIDIDTSGHVFLANAAATVVATGTIAVPAGRWFRIEFHMIAGATTGTIESKLFTSADGTIPDETLTATNTNMNTQFTKYDFGMTVAVANMSFWIDDILIDTTGWPGPSQSAGSRSVSAPATAGLNVVLNGTNQTPTYTLPLSVIDTTGTSAGWNLTITSTQFTSGAPVHTLATSTSTIQSVAVVCTAAACVTPVNSLTYALAIPAGPGPPAPVQFFDSALGTGMGTFTLTPSIQVAIPASSFAGSYTSIVTVTIASGP
jgi:hypothetical protein